MFEIAGCACRLPTSSINKGMITGNYNDSNNMSHGFMAKGVIRSPK